MRPLLKLEFAERTRPPAVAIGVILVAAVGTAYVSGKVGAVRNQLEEKHARLQQLKHEVGEHKLKIDRLSKVTDIDAQRMAENSNASRTLDYPWNGVFSPIEDSKTSQVTLLSFIHDRTRGKTELTVEAASVSEIIDFIKALNIGRERNYFYVANYQVETQTQLRPGVKAKIVQMP